MKLSQSTLITFSPTLTSLSIGQKIQEGFDADEAHVYDLTLGEKTLPTLNDNAIAIFSVPVYGGFVAPLALQRMEAIKGNNTPAVIVVVYGNRDYEQALTQLESFVIQRGFRVIAAATFIGEHSYSTANTPIATGRPDFTDLDEAHNFGCTIRNKADSYSNAQLIPTIQASKIQRPKQPLWPLLRFIFNVIKLRKSKRPMPSSPSVNEALCKHCGICAKNCPTQAITPLQEHLTMTERCIKCCACVKSCPHKARTFATPFATLLSKHFTTRKTNQTLA